MADFSKFRSALNGFNRTDVVNYVEAVSLEHQKETRQLREETERLAAERDALTVEKAALVRENAALREKLAQTEDALHALEEALDAQTQPEPVPEMGQETEARTGAEPTPGTGAEPCGTAAEPCGTAAEPDESTERQELEAYRRAAQTEHNAALRARKLGERLNALCDSARSRYQDTGEDIAALSADLSVNIDRLQEAIAGLQLIFDEAEEEFSSLELPDEA